MTRDEAIEIIVKYQYPNISKADAGVYVDAYAALGMLKLDTPVSVEDRAITSLTISLGRINKSYGSNDTDKLNASYIIGRLEADGLKIVAK